MTTKVLYLFSTNGSSRFDETFSDKSTSNFHFISPLVARRISPYPFSGGFVVNSVSLQSSAIAVATVGRRFRRNLTSVKSSMLTENPVMNDLCATALSNGVALSLLQFWGEIAKRGVFDQKLIRKLVHISIGLAFMLLWPLFSSRSQAAFFAAFVPGINIIRMLLLGLGIWKDEATVKSMSRFGDYRELLKGPLYYACTITIAAIIYWRTSPIAIAAMCSLCAGDGVADIVGRRLGKQKLPYNRNKSFAGTISMATASFITSLGYMHYFSSFGFIEESWGMVVGFLIVSLVTAIVESLPISAELDDNLTVPLTSILVGSLVF